MSGAQSRILKNELKRKRISLFFSPSVNTSVFAAENNWEEFWTFPLRGN